MFCILILSICLVSCQKDDGAVNENDNEAAMTYSSTERAPSFDYARANALIQEDIAVNGRPDLPMDQSTVDRYLEIAGISGSMDREQVSRLSEEVYTAQELGLKKYLNERLHVKEFTSNTILSIVDKGPNSGIENDPTFRDLPQNEQDMIRGANNIAESFKNKGLLRTNDPADQLLGAVTYGIAGFAAGMGLCGLPCGVVGGVVGAVWGWFTGSDGQK